MTAKFDDPKTKALLASVSGSAAVFRAVFIAYLIFAGYAGTIILSVTDRDLFLDAALTAPVLNVKFKTSYFFIVVPCIFLLLHLNLLAHMSVLVKKLKAYRENINSDSAMLVLLFDAPQPAPRSPSDSDSAMLGLLPDVLLIQSADKGHSSIFRTIFLKGIFIYGALMVLPIFILCFIYKEFLAFQDNFITGIHIGVIFIDGFFVMYFSSYMKKIYTIQENRNFFIRWGDVLFVAIINIFLAIGLFVLLDYFRINKLYISVDSIVVHAKKITELDVLDVSGERLYLDSHISPNEACKKENKTLGAVLKNRSYKGANLEGAILCHVNLIGSQLQGAHLSKAQLQSAVLVSVQLQGADLRGAGLQGANLEGVELQGENLRRAELQGANLEGAELQGADLRGAELQGANLERAELQGANLEEAELQGADLEGAGLQGADLEGAGLQGADLRGAGLQGAGLEEAELQGANLRRAELQGANLEEAELQGADLRGAELQGANLEGAGLQGAYSGSVVLENTPRSFARFNEVITLRVGNPGKLSAGNRAVVAITNMTAYIQKITTVMGEFVDNDRVSQFIKRMKESEASPSVDLSQADKGSYTKEEANEWIKGYKEAMCKIPEDIYEEKYGEKLDCP